MIHILPQVLCNIFLKILRNWYSCKHCNLYFSREDSYYCLIVLQNVINYSEFCFRTTENVRTKGQLISKALYGLLTSPKKRTKEFVLFAFLLFTANKSNWSVRFFGESMTRQPAFWFYLTFTRYCWLLLFFEYH